MTKLCHVVPRERGGGDEDRRRLSAGARKVEQICNSVFRGDIWNGNTQPSPKAICVSVQGKNLSICSLLSPRSSWRLISKASMHHCSCTQLGIADDHGCMVGMKGDRGGREANLKSDPQSFVVCLRVCQLGRFGAHALRQEQRGGCMGEGQVGGMVRVMPACLVGFYSNINVHQ